MFHEKMYNTSINNDNEGNNEKYDHIFIVYLTTIKRDS